MQGRPGGDGVQHAVPQSHRPPSLQSRFKAGAQGAVIAAGTNESEDALAIPPGEHEASPVSSGVLVKVSVGGSPQSAVGILKGGDIGAEGCKFHREGGLGFCRSQRAAGAANLADTNGARAQGARRVFAPQVG